MRREYGDYVQDILDSIEAIEEFVKDVDYKYFETLKIPLLY